MLNSPPSAHRHTYVRWTTFGGKLFLAASFREVFLDSFRWRSFGCFALRATDFHETGNPYYDGR